MANLCRPTTNLTLSVHISLFLFHQEVSGHDSFLHLHRRRTEQGVASSALVDLTGRRSEKLKVDLFENTYQLPSRLFFHFLFVIFSALFRALSFPFTSPSTSQGIDLGSPEVPFYSHSPDAPVVEEETLKKRKVRRKWGPREDNVLISAWLNTSKDPIVGNQQKAGTFWKRIAVYFNSSPNVAELPPRDQTILKQRWQKINDLVSKFVGAYEAAKTQTTSGQNENDTLNLAHQIFHNDHHIAFTLEYAWKVLHNDQKWCASFNTKTGGSSKRRRGDGSSPIVLEDVDEAMAQPI
ncbi:unnamed protein product [Microthlaspi erraticum]|uniref:Myb-like domain-containing protein n=1 Tax=Microthlaspi erraticum TaxID=1685480 RepID=A0A6D2JRQ3_9BRAS|nr:unnamed protein product [Microthlaspi erraticum]